MVDPFGVSAAKDDVAVQTWFEVKALLEVELRFVPHVMLKVKVFPAAISFSQSTSLSVAAEGKFILYGSSSVEEGAIS